MKIVITGCNGFVGKRVVKLALEQGNTVLGIDVVPVDYSPPPLEYTFKQGDLRDFQVVLNLLQGYDAVINLAAHRTPGDYKVETHNK